LGTRYRSGRRQIGNQMATLLSVRELFLPFSDPLNPTAPTPQQLQTLQRAQRISAKVSGCAALEKMAQEVHSPRPVDPGPVQLDQVNPPGFRAMLASLPLGKATKPLVTSDGIGVMMVCAREERNLDPIDAERVKAQILEKRVDLLSRQIQDDLRRRATIDMRVADRGGPEA
jgi:peptidyl-prolyl cis-trans isomerase SurA